MLELEVSSLEDELPLLLELDLPLLEDDSSSRDTDELDEESLVELEDIEVSSLEEDSGSSLLALEESLPQAAKKSREQIGSNL